MIDKEFHVLGLESSCDDTAAAVLRFETSGRAHILSSVVMGQNALHAAYGGVVPEIAARAHSERIDLCVEQAVKLPGLQLKDVDVIAATSGPGLIGGVLSAVMCAKGLAKGLGKPLIGVNHLAGHALTPRLTDHIAFPYLMLLVSGGHCQFLAVKGPNDFSRIGGTIDDAPGEAFDKVARLLGLPQPGGPSVEQWAKTGDPNRFKFPRPLLDRSGCDMSFSGLKTALLRTRDALVDAQGGLYDIDIADICSGFQTAVGDVMAEKLSRAIKEFLAVSPMGQTVAIAGGVAANDYLRGRLAAICSNHHMLFTAPPLALCTDNAAMIAYAGGTLYQLGQVDDQRLSARPRWPLDVAQLALLGGGKKGAKA